MNPMKTFREVDLKRVVDPRGDLIVGQYGDQIPFVVRRYFLIFNVPDFELRGAHAHKQCHQLLICLTGSCVVDVDDGAHQATYVLGSPAAGVYLPPMVWGVQRNYSKGAMLLVLASHDYDEDDYIRNHDDFKRLAGLST